LKNDYVELKASASCRVLITFPFDFDTIYFYKIINRRVAIEGYFAKGSLHKRSESPISGRTF